MAGSARNSMRTMGCVLCMVLVMLVPVKMVKGQDIDFDDCFATLEDLRIAMEAEFVQVLAFNNASRFAPYVYKLCEDTVYEVDDDGVNVIYPLLDRTIIQCGDFGRSSGGCEVTESDTSGRKAFPEVALASFDMISYGYIRTQTDFAGITFTTPYGISVFALDRFPATATFTDCHWKGHRVATLIDIAPPEENPNIRDIGTNGMIIVLDDCSVENEQLSLGSNEPYNVSDTPSAFAITSFASSLIINNLDFRNNTLGYGIYSSVTRLFISRSQFLDSDALETLLAVYSIAIIENSRFAHNRHLSGSIAAVDSGINVSLCEFENNAGLADVVVVDDGRDGGIDGYFGSLVDIDNSCFSGGLYTTGPVFVAGIDNLYKPFNNYVDDIVGECPAETFVEPIDQLCLNGYNLLLPGTNCEGTCANGGFDAASCPRKNGGIVLPSTGDYMSFGSGTSLGPDDGTRIETSSKPTDAPASSPTNGGVILSSRGEGGSTASGGDDGFCESGAGPLVCIGFPIIFGAIIIAAVIVIVNNRRHRKESLDHVAEMEIPPPRAPSSFSGSVSESQGSLT